MKALIYCLLFGISILEPTLIYAQAPYNDICGNAYNLYCSSNQGGYIVAATDSDAPSPCQGPPGSGTVDASPGIWFTFTGTGDTMTLSTDNDYTDFDTEIQLFQGLCGALTCIGGDDNGGTDFLSGLTSVLQFLSEKDSTYYVYVDGHASAVGFFEITLECNCIPPIFDFTIDSSQLCINNAFNIQVNVTDFGVANLIRIITVPGSSSSYLFEPGTTTLNDIPIHLDGLLVVKDEYDATCADSMPFLSPVVCPPPHDICIDAIDIICGDQINHVTSYSSGVGAPSACMGPPGAGSLDSGPGVWHTFVGSGDSMTLTTDHPGTNFDTELQLFKGSCSNLICVGGDDNSGSGNTSTIHFLSEHDVRYYLYVDGDGGSVGDYELSLNCICVLPTYTVIVDTLCSGSQFEIQVNITELGSSPYVNLSNSANGYNRSFLGIGNHFMGNNSPGSMGFIYVQTVGDSACRDSVLFSTPLGCRPDNDLCVDAEYFYCHESVVGQIDFATGNDEPANCAGPPGDGSVSSGGGVWYQFEGTGDSMTLSTDHIATDFDTEIQLFRGTCGNLTCIGADDNSGNNNTSMLTFYSQVDSTYLVYLTGSGSSIGTFELSLSCVCVPPTFTVYFDSICSDEEFGIRINIIDVGSTRYVDGANSIDSRTLNNVQEGIEHGGFYDPGEQGDYYVFHDGDLFCADTVAFEAPAGCRPENDLCHDAETLNCFETMSGTTLYSTSNGTPVSCAGPPGSGMINGQAGVWYTFNGTGDSLTLSTSHSGTNYDTEIQLYRGQCGNLVCIGGDNDGGIDSTSTLTFLSELDSIYYVYISGHDGSSGDFELSLNCNCVPATFLAYPAGCPGNFELHVNVLDLGPILDYNGVNVTNSVNGSSYLSGTGEGVIVLDGFQANDSGYVYVWGYDLPDCIDSMFFIIPEQCTPQHDICDEAIYLSCGATYSDSTDLANQAEVFPACQDTVAGDTTDVSKGVWFRFDGTGYDIIISTDHPGTNFNTELQLFEGNCYNLICIAGDDNGGSGTTSRIQFQSERYEEYYIYLDGHDGAFGHYELSIDCVCQLATATAYPECTPDFVTTVEVTEIGSAFDLHISNNVGSQSHVIGYNQSISFDDLSPNDSGEIYLMDVADSSCIDTINFSMPAACPPENDRCSEAIYLDCDDFYSDSTHYASSIGLDSICQNTSESIEIGAGVWFEFFGTGDSMTISTDHPGTNFDTELMLYEGYQCDNLACIAADDNGGSDGKSRIKFLSERDFYRIYLDGNMNEVGHYEISLTCDRPENDSCHLATNLTIGPFGSCPANQTDGSLLAATPDYTTCDMDIETGVWYSFTTDATQDEILIRYGDEDISPWEFELEILDACNGSSVYCEQGEGRNGLLLLDVSPSTEYKILIFSDDNADNFSICIENAPPIPSNDVCANAIPLSCDDMVQGHTIKATDTDAPMICHGPNGNGNVEDPYAGVWYQFVGTGDTMTVSTDPLATDFRVQLVLYTGSCSSLQCIGADFSSELNQSVISFLSEVGLTYYVYVQGENDFRGSFGLTLTCRCPSALSLNGITSGNAHYQSGGQLTSTQIIQSGDTVDYEAGMHVELLPDFEVELGAVFHAYIGGCDYSGNTQLRIEQQQRVSELLEAVTKSSRRNDNIRDQGKLNNSNAATSQNLNTPKPVKNIFNLYDLFELRHDLLKY